MLGVTLRENNLSSVFYMALMICVTLSGACADETNDATNAEDSMSERGAVDISDAVFTRRDQACSAYVGVYTSLAVYPLL